MRLIRVGHNKLSKVCFTDKKRICSRTPAEKSIERRSMEANKREVYGHWKGDLIGNKKKGAVLFTLTERKTREEIILKMPSKKRIANYISVSRIIMSILMIDTKTFSIPFFIIYSYCGLSDIADGFFARKYNAESKLGEIIDSLADIVFVLAAMVKIILILNLPKEIFIWIIAIVTIKFFGIMYGCICYKKIIFLHTMANKIIGFVLFITPFFMVKINSVIIYVCLCTFATFAAVLECYYIIKVKQKFS